MAVIVVMVTVVVSVTLCGRVVVVDTMVVVVRKLLHELWTDQEGIAQVVLERALLSFVWGHYLEHL